VNRQGRRTGAFSWRRFAPQLKRDVGADVNMILNSLAVLLAVIALSVIVMNYACVIASYRNRLRGIDRHHSTLPLVPQILLVLADRASSIAPARVLPWPWLLGLALADIGLWVLLVALFSVLVRHRPNTVSR
jgi:uncharacterized membrane protein